jgi:hypothetical protein
MSSPYWNRFSRLLRQRIRSKTLHVKCVSANAYSGSMRLRGLLSVLMLAALLSACATSPPLTMPDGPLPDLRGTWTGTWGGTPVSLLLLEQREAGPVDGVTIGPWHVFGRELPGVAGILTFTSRGEPVSVNVRGQLGDLNGRLALVLEPLTVNGGHIALTRIEPNRLAGTGASAMRWEPQGPVELARQAAGPGTSR